MSSVNNDNFGSSFTICTTICFLSFMSLAQNFSTILHRNFKWTSLFIPNVRGKTFRLSPLTITLALGF